MFNEIKKEIDWNGKTLTLETGKIARQASGSVVATMGKTVVLCAVTISKTPKENLNFLPLTVHFIEKYYAANKIPGSFFKREAKPSDNATLISRLIDRPIRPLFPEDFYNEINVICTVLSYDPSCNPDIVAMIGASAALSISEAPFTDPIAGARVGYIDDKYVLNPGREELKNSKLNLVAAGTQSSILMVESEAKELNEKIMLGAVNFCHEQMQPVIQLIKQLTDIAGKPKLVIKSKYKAILEKEDMTHFAGDKIAAAYLDEDISKFAKDKLADAYKKMDKQERTTELNNIKAEILEKFISEEHHIDTNIISAIVKKLEKGIVRGNIFSSSKRIDGRKIDEIRDIQSDVSILPQAHGSALFTRGETQALVVATIGSSRDEQIIDGLDEGINKETFMLHYNFPPYSVGEVGQLKPPGRREIGHGKLAFRAINPVFPSQETFPYVTRVVSEITESNGSSSMATVCGTSLALMDAGIPLKKPVAGIAMGLIKDGDKYLVLSDIMGDEDHLGDMDFKVAGTSEGITALQMDIKISGIDSKIMQEALKQANTGRLHILEKMAEAISSPRTELNSNIPRMEIINIPTRKIKDVIGSRGKVIKGICEETGVVIDINDDGVVKITSSNNEAIKKAIAIIEEIAVEPEFGTIYEGNVVKIIDAGAFVNIMPNKDGFVHISELAEYRVDFVEDIINEGDVVKVKVIGFDKKGRPKLSYRSVDQKTGKDISHKFADAEESRPRRKFFN